MDTNFCGSHEQAQEDPRHQEAAYTGAAHQEDTQGEEEGPALPHEEVRRQGLSA